MFNIAEQLQAWLSDQQLLRSTDDGEMASSGLPGLESIMMQGPEPPMLHVPQTVSSDPMTGAYLQALRVALTGNVGLSEGGLELGSYHIQPASEPSSQQASLLNSSQAQSVHAEQQQRAGHLSAPDSVAPTLKGPGWRKYGQKRLSNNQITSYYRCSVQGCNVKRQVVGSEGDSESVGEVRTFGEHTHADGLFNVLELGLSSKRKRPRNGSDAPEQRAKPASDPQVEPEGSSSAQMIDLDDQQLDGLDGPYMAHEVVLNEVAPQLDIHLATRLLGAAPAFVTTDGSSQSSAPMVSVSAGFVELTGFRIGDIRGMPLQYLQVACNGIDPVTCEEGHGIILCSRKNASPFWCLTNTAKVTAGNRVANVTYMLNISEIPAERNH